MLEIYSSRQNQSVIDLTVTGLEHFAVKEGEEPVLCWTVSTRASDKIKGYVPYYEAGVEGQNEREIEREMLRFLGQKISGVVYAINTNAGYFVASRKQAMERQAKRLWENIFEGAKIEVIVRRTTPNRIVGEYRGVEVVIPKQEASHGWIEHTSQVAKPGDEIEAKVIKLDKENKRLIASIKALKASPWQEASKKYQKGGIYAGKVTGIASFGIFVELEPGVSVLCNHLKAGTANIGDTVAVLITKIDHAERKISGKALRVVSRKAM
ncbi:S1 RNA-binding domain-containing protein [Carboxydothermus ferrireducens]|uniref:Ribosomal protein S1 n=1 Tax=Carboxydothermus ferrireducens DSM 11255 TaxID=1119529 RepID=A0ABX2R7M0_9THEO|nr:S1 RNA-binding domain-containing protein [Carboxydothermus ferrireducens]NYE57171.1 ribosomal protein S1 [Carboxydothermus ferrireducens DSM 11255]